jgi:hypothetical protein
MAHVPIGPIWKLVLPGRDVLIKGRLRNAVRGERRAIRIFTHVNGAFPRTSIRKWFTRVSKSIYMIKGHKITRTASRSNLH